MKKTKVLMACLAAVTLVLAGCGSSEADDDGATDAGDSTTQDADAGANTDTDAGEPDADADEPADEPADAPAGDHSFVLITPDPIGVNKFLELGKTGIETAASEFGGTSKVYESTDPVSWESNLDAAIDEEPDVIVMIGFEFVDLAQDRAENNPDQEFLLIDACSQEVPDNLHCAVFREHEAAYLIGIEAGMLTESNKTGSVVAADIPLLHRYSDGFAAGVQSVNSGATDQQLFIGGDNPFSDPAKAKEQALAMAATGADQIFAVGAGSNGGIFEAAKEEGFFTYGVDVNQCPDAPDNVLDNTMKAVDVLVVSEIEAILNGNSQPGSVNSYGLAEGGMNVTSLSDQADGSQCGVLDHADVMDAITQAKNDIIDGTVTVADPMAG